MYIQKEFRFEAAHRLPCHAGACAHLHGHSYRVVVGVEGDLQTEGPATGMVLDFHTLTDVVRGIIDEGRWRGLDVVPWDHAVILHHQDPLLKVLQDANIAGHIPARFLAMVEQPTAENMAALLASMIQEGLEHAGAEGVFVVRLEVWETATACAMWEA